MLQDLPEVDMSMSNQKSYEVLIYSPDRHIAYDGNTPEQVGVGGGISARIRISRALARLGHRVTHVGNCPTSIQNDGVKYFSLDDFEGGIVDIAVLTTSGGGLDLRPARSVILKAKLRTVWIHGTDKPWGLDDLDYDVLFSVSDFIRDIARNSWDIPMEKTITTYNGFDPGQFQHDVDIERDPYQLIYFGHPSKGLKAALNVVLILRQMDSRYHLEVFGGEALWGGVDKGYELPKGVTYHGMVGQKELACHLQSSGFSIQLQRRQEPGALAIPDAKRAGCLIVASPVGVYPERIVDGRNGILVAGDAFSTNTKLEAAQRIHEINEDVGRRREMELEARDSAKSIDDTARDWIRCWDQFL